MSTIMYLYDDTCHSHVKKGLNMWKNGGLVDNVKQLLVNRLYNLTF